MAKPNLLAYEVRTLLRSVDEQVAEKVYSHGLDGKAFSALKLSDLNELLGLKVSAKALSQLQAALKRGRISGDKKKSPVKRAPTNSSAKALTAYDLRSILKNFNESVGEKLYSNGIGGERFFALGQEDVKKLELNLNDKELNSLKEAVKGAGSSEIPMFLQSKVFDCAIGGYEHKEGDLGIGYYLVDKTKASLETAAAVLMTKQKRIVENLNDLKTNPPSWENLKKQQFKLIETAKKMLGKEAENSDKGTIPKKDIEALNERFSAVISDALQILSSLEGGASNKCEKKKQKQQPQETGKTSKKNKKEQKKKQPKKSQKKKSPKKDSSSEDKKIVDLIKKIEDNTVIKNLEDNEKRLQNLEASLEMLKEDPALLKEEDELFAKLFSKLNEQSTKLEKLEKEVGITSKPLSSSSTTQLVDRQDKQWAEINKLREVINKLSKSEGLPPIEAPKRVPANLGSSCNKEQLELVNRQDKQWVEINRVREIINKLSKAEGLPLIEEPKRISANLPIPSSRGQAELIKRQNKQWNDINKLREVINKLSKSQGLAPIEAPKRIPASLNFKDDSKEIMALNKKYDKIYEGISGLTAVLNRLDGPTVEQKYDSIFAQIPGLDKRIANLEKNTESKKIIAKEKKQTKQVKKQMKKGGSPKKDDKELKALEKQMNNFEKRLDNLEKTFG